MESNKKKDLLLSPKSTRTINNTKSINNTLYNMKSINSTINSEFKEKYLKKEDEVYDFNTNSYVKSKIQDSRVQNSRVQDSRVQSSRVQDLINKYNVRKESSLMNPINVMYVPRSIPSKNTVGRSDNPFTRDCISVKSENTIRRSVKSDTSMYDTNKYDTSKYDTSKYDNSKYNNTGFHSPKFDNRIGDSYLSRPNSTIRQERSFLPIQERLNSTIRQERPNSTIRQERPASAYSPGKGNFYSSDSPFYNTRNIPSPFTRKDDFQSRMSHNDSQSSNELVLYGPSVLLTLPLSFTILNTVYSFNKEVETSLYYIEVTSNITWTIKKDLKEILNLLKEPVLRTKGLDKQVRDNMISTLLNKVEMNKDLQYFIMTDITREKTYKGEYLLLDNIPYIFKLVGKALVSYNILNRVHKIFILEECEVKEGRNEYSFFIRNREGQVELYASCRIERDEWIKDIVNFINKQ